MILIRSTDTKHVADFTQLLPLRNSQINYGLLYRACKQEPAKKKRGAMRVRVTTEGRLLGLDIGDWWTLIAGSTLAGLLAFLL